MDEMNQAVDVFENRISFSVKEKKFCAKKKIKIGDPIFEVIWWKEGSFSKFVKKKKRRILQKKKMQEKSFCRKSFNQTLFGRKTIIFF